MLALALCIAGGLLFFEISSLKDDLKEAYTLLQKSNKELAFVKNSLSLCQSSLDEQNKSFAAYRIKEEKNKNELQKEYSQLKEKYGKLSASIEREVLSCEDMLQAINDYQRQFLSAKGVNH